MSIRIIGLLATISFSHFVFPAFAEESSAINEGGGRCPANQQGCIDKFKEDAADYIKDKVPGEYTNKDAAERSKSAGEIVKDCGSCLMDEYERQLNEIVGDHRRLKNEK